MGTFFELETFDGETIRLGKQSAGWRFTVAEGSRIKSFRDMVNVLETTPGVVVAETGERLDPVTFVRERIVTDAGRVLTDAERRIPYTGRVYAVADVDGFDVVSGDWS